MSELFQTTELIFDLGVRSATAVCLMRKEPDEGRVECVAAETLEMSPGEFTKCQLIPEI